MFAQLREKHNISYFFHVTYRASYEEVSILFAIEVSKRRGGSGHPRTHVGLESNE
jgi:hypothetical protein